MFIYNSVEPDSLQACVCVDIDSWQDHAHWSGIDRSQACVHVDMDSWRDHAHWFGTDSLQACLCWHW